MNKLPKIVEEKLAKCNMAILEVEPILLEPKNPDTIKDFLLSLELERIKVYTMIINVSS